MKTKYLILALSYLQISIEKYVLNHLIRLLYNFNFIFRRRYIVILKNQILKTYPLKSTISNVDFALKLKIYRSLKVLFVSNESYS